MLKESTIAFQASGTENIGLNGWALSDFDKCCHSLEMTQLLYIQ